MTPLIELNQIRKTYGDGETSVRVLHGIDLKIEPGEYVAIIGPSGSGKSTLMNILGCLDTPSSGKYLLNGKNVADLTEDELAKVRAENVGFVFQSFNLLPMTVYKNVELPLIYHSQIGKAERKALVEDALRLADVPHDRWHHHPSELSGGQRQRVAIARALVAQPSILLADEPTGNLDSKTGAHVLSTFQAINEKRGATLIVITHDINVAKQAKRVVQIKDGYLTQKHALK